MNTLKRISMAVLLAFALIPVPGFAQAIEPFGGKDYSKELYQELQGSELPDVRLLLEKCIVADHEGVRIQGPDMECIKDLLSHGMGNEVLDTSDMVLAGDQVTVVSLMTGSGVVKHTFLIFRKEEGNGSFSLLMGAHFYDRDRSHSCNTDGIFEKTCLTELEAIYKCEEKHG